MKLEEITAAAVTILALIFAYFRFIPIIERSIQHAPAAVHAMVTNPGDALIDMIPLFIVLILVGFALNYLRSSNGVATRNL